MPCDEGCRTAVLGKTERTVGWEGNGEVIMNGLVRHCQGKPAETDRPFLKLRNHSFTLDIVCHCARMKEAVLLKGAVKARLREVGLDINERKSNVVYIDTFKRWNVKTRFTFLGYDFKVRTLKNFKGEVYRKCMPGASKKAMRKITQTIKSWRIHRNTVDNAEGIAKRYNVILRGWIEYYGKFWYRNFSYHLWSVFQSRLVKWMKMRYRLSTRKAERKLALLRKANPKLFAHWYLLRATNA